MVDTANMNQVKRGRGRPPIAPKLRRSTVLSLRISPLEKQEIEARAERAGKTVFEYVRQVLGWTDRAA